MLTNKNAQMTPRNLVTNTQDGQIIHSCNEPHTVLTMCVYINLAKPTGHVMHQQFNIQQLYALPTLYLCVLYLSENKQRLVPLTA